MDPLPKPPDISALNGHHLRLKTRRRCTRSTSFLLSGNDQNYTFLNHHMTCLPVLYFFVMNVFCSRQSLLNRIILSVDPQLLKQMRTFKFTQFFRICQRSMLFTRPFMHNGRASNIAFTRKFVARSNGITEMV